MKTLNLYNATSPLLAAAKPTAKSKDTVRILLIDADLAARCEGLAVPTLPASFKGQPGDRADLATPQGRVVVVGCSKLADAATEPRAWESAGAAVIDAMRALKIASAALAGNLIPVHADRKAAAGNFALGAALAAYQCTAYRTVMPKTHFEVKSLQLSAADWNASAQGRELAAAVNWSRALVDAPANLLTPQTFVAEAKQLKSLGVSIEVLDIPALEKIGAGGLLAVGRSSEHPPCMLICRWNGRKGKTKGTDLGLVGKGLTFDGGGLNLKPYPGIAKMKFDMAGAAAVVGALRVIAARKLPLNVAAAIPLCENVIDGTAFRPGDVITSLSGLTIEVDNTDAEGRIVLADAMAHLVKTSKPAVMLDVATLTGAIMSALHEEFAGLFTADDALATDLQAAAEASSEAIWRMPLSKRQDYLVDSDIADVKNTAAPGFMGAGMGSSIGGAKFLERFATGTRWAHLDIAGTAWSTRPQPGIPRGATGYGVRLLSAFAEQQGTKK